MACLCGSASPLRFIDMHNDTKHTRASLHLPGNLVQDNYLGAASLKVPCWLGGTVI